MDIKELYRYTKGLNILFAEDEADARSALKSILSKLFKEIDEAENGKVALEKFVQNRDKYDIVLTDINMPVMDGIELIKEIRKECQLIPILVLSAYSDSERLIEIINAGADSFISKPFKLNLVSSVLYRMSVRASDTRVLKEYIEKLEEQNIELLNLKNKVERQDNIIKAKIVNESLQAVMNEPKKEAPKAIGSNYYKDILEEDVSELVDLVSEVESFVILAFQENRTDATYADRISSSFQKFGSILYRYPVFGDLSQALFELAKYIAEHSGEFIQKQDFVVPFLENLIFVLHKYVDDVWKKPASNPHFYDASMINDIKTFISIIGGVEQNTNIKTDDILEFF